MLGAGTLVFGEFGERARAQACASGRADRLSPLVNERWGMTARELLFG